MKIFLTTSALSLALFVYRIVDLPPRMLDDLRIDYLSIHFFSFVISTILFSYLISYIWFKHEELKNTLLQRNLVKRSGCTVVVFGTLAYSYFVHKASYLVLFATSNDYWWSDSTYYRDGYLLLTWDADTFLMSTLILSVGYLILIKDFKKPSAAAVAQTKPRINKYSILVIIALSFTIPFFDYFSGFDEEYFFNAISFSVIGVVGYYILRFEKYSMFKRIVTLLVVEAVLVTIAFSLCISTGICSIMY